MLYGVEVLLVGAFVAEVARNQGRAAWLLLVVAWAVPAPPARVGVWQRSRRRRYHGLLDGKFAILPSFCHFCNRFAIITRENASFCHFAIFTIFAIFYNLLPSFCNIFAIILPSLEVPGKGFQD